MRRTSRRRLPCAAPPPHRCPPTQRRHPHTLRATRLRIAPSAPRPRPFSRRRPSTTAPMSCVGQTLTTRTPTTCSWTMAPTTSTIPTVTTTSTSVRQPATSMWRAIPHRHQTPHLRVAPGRLLSPRCRAICAAMVVAANSSLGRPVVVHRSSSLECYSAGGRPGRRCLPPPRHPQRPQGTATGRIPIHLRLGPREEAVGHVPVHKCAQGTAGCYIPVHLRLELRVPDAVMHQPCRRRFSPPDAKGWSEVFPRQVSGTPQPHSAAPRPKPTPRRSLPALLDRRCLNCLSCSHRRATCTHPTRCLRCFNLHHIARDCKHPLKPPIDSFATGAARSLRREVCHRREVFSVANEGLD